MPHLRRLLLALTIWFASCPVVPGANVAADTVPLEKLTWRHRNPYPIGQGLTGIVASPECFIAYGGGGLILRSANGIFWDVITMPLKTTFIDGRWSDGEFLLVGGNYVVTSPDGLAWTIRELPLRDDGFPPSIYSVGRHGDRRVVLAYEGLYVSDDGENWELWPFPDVAGYNWMAVGPDRILVSKTKFENGSLHYSLATVTGPTAWAFTPAIFSDGYADLDYADGNYVALGDGGIAVSGDGESWELVATALNYGYGSFRRVAGRWLLVDGGSSFLESFDAHTWTRHDVAAFTYLGYLAVRAPGVWVATGDYGGFATSIDQVNWIRRDAGVAPTMHAIARVADRWVAVGQMGTVMSSSDGVHWDQQVLPNDSGNFYNVIADGSVLYAPSELGSFSTTDGVHWTAAATLPPTQWDFSGLPEFYVPWYSPTWVGDRWLLQANIPRVGAGALFSSTDGSNWTMLLQQGLFITSVAGRPGAYVATGGSGTGILFSTDTVTWENIPLEQTYFATPTVVLEGYGWFLSGTIQGIIASQNGRDWQWLPGITGQIYGGARIGESFWFTGEYGTIIEVMPHLEAPIANLSTRAFQRSDGLPTIAGFSIEGSEPVDVLVRAVGSGLRDYAVDDVLERPTLHLYKGSVETMSAGDWAASSDRAAIETATQHTGAFVLSEEGGDAAFTARLPAGTYTAVVGSAGTTDGSILVEVYDSSANAGSSDGGRLANSSTRGEATVDHPLIGGLVISGDHPRRVLIRGVGPGLLEHDVPTAAADPRLEIFRAQTVIAENDDWGRTGDPLLIADAAAETQAFPLADDSLDAAIVVTLDPGLYTVHVRPAKNSAGGDVLLETYYLD